MDTLSEKQVQRMISMAVRAAVVEAMSPAVSQSTAETWVKLGISAATPEALIEVQRDFAYMRAQRLKSERLFPLIRKIILGTLIVAGLVALWEGVRVLLNAGVS